MFGVLLSTLGNLFGEISSSIGKHEVWKKKESIYTMGFLNTFWGVIIFLIIILAKREFAFSLESLPTFSIRAILEVLQAHFTIKAICISDRSTFGFIRAITIPLLLVVDLALGYSIGTFQYMGIFLILVAFVVVFVNHGIKKEGAFFILFTSVNAVLTISLYKYNITNFNSVESEQFLIYAILVAYFIFMTFYLKNENPFKLILKPIFFGQAASQGIGSLLLSFAYVFAPASVIIAVKRSSSVLWSVVFGRVYFHEKHIVIKIFCMLLIIAGIALLAI
jgi:multidrug transporter EmrE-like cation transporter